MDSSIPECYTDYALQEFALGRLSATTRSGIQEHVSVCSACAKALGEIELEVCYFREMETVIKEEVTDACPDDEEMALFIDGGLDAKGVTTMVSHVHGCQECRLRLIEMRREIARALEQSEGITAGEPDESSVILTMPKRLGMDKGRGLGLPEYDLKRYGTDP